MNEEDILTVTHALTFARERAEEAAKLAETDVLLDSSETMLPPPPEGLKNDHGKAMWDLLPWCAVEQVVLVMTHGAAKYGAGNWRHVDGHRYIAAIMRHLAQWRAGERIDRESGLPHLAHAACSLLFVLAQELGSRPETGERQ